MYFFEKKYILYTSKILLAADGFIEKTFYRKKNVYGGDILKENAKNNSRAPLRIREFPCEERPRERLAVVGPKALSDAELLAIILKTGRPGENALDLARRVISKSRNSSLSGVYDMTLEELKKIKGIGQAKAAQVAAVCELSSRIGADKAGIKRLNIASIPQLGEMLVSRLKWLNKEVFEIVLVDCRWHVINTVRISEGSLNQSIVHPREVFVEALKNYCTAVVLVHNHPSGNPAPSSEDFETTERLIRAGRLLGIEVVDHIVTGSDTYYSMHMYGDMDRLRSRTSDI